jgi:hypothetical protein
VLVLEHNEREVKRKGRTTGNTEDPDEVIHIKCQFILEYLLSPEINQSNGGTNIMLIFLSMLAQVIVIFLLDKLVPSTHEEAYVSANDSKYIATPFQDSSCS